MDRAAAELFMDSLQSSKKRTIVVVDFGNVDKWKHSLGWIVGIRELARFVKTISQGNRCLRRFYYGSDYGPDDGSTRIKPWSESILRTAAWSGLEVVTKRVKYIRTRNNSYGYEKKCDLDVEIVVDLIRERDKYDTIVLFSGDGDFVYAFDYLHRTFGKRIIVFGVRNYIGREIFTARQRGIVYKIKYAQDFKHRLGV